MDGLYRYQSDSNPSIKNFKSLHTVALFSGILGVIQSIIWIGLTITAIVAYNCMIPVPNTEIERTGSLFPHIFLKLYFKGDCLPNGYQNINLPTFETVLQSKDILIWMCIYLGLSVCWLLSSFLMAIQIKKNALGLTIIDLCFWITITIVILIMDLALAIIFGIDYNKFYNKSFESDQYNSKMFYISSIASITMMIISLKGFILYIINVVLVVYLLYFTVNIQSDSYVKRLSSRRRLSNDIMATCPPIQAYEAETNTHSPNVYKNETFIGDEQPHLRKIELNQDSIARAARMSTDTSLQDRRFRNFATFSQYPPQSTNTKILNETIRPESTEVLFPAPDYSPPPIRNIRF